MDNFVMIAYAIVITVLAVVWLVVEFRLNALIKRLEKELDAKLIDAVDVDKWLDEFLNEPDEETTEVEEVDEGELDAELQAVLDDFNSLIEAEDTGEDENEEDEGNV